MHSLLYCCIRQKIILRLNSGARYGSSMESKLGTAIGHLKLVTLRDLLDSNCEESTIIQVNPALKGDNAKDTSLKNVKISASRITNVCFAELEVPNAKKFSQSRD